MATQFALQPFFTPDEFFADAVFSCGLFQIEDEAFVAELADLASDILTVATGGVVKGRTTTTFRPVHCAGSVVVNEMVGTYAPTINGRRPLPLPGPNPVIREVTVDGVTLGPTQYRVVDGNLLIRVGAEWPTSNDLELDESEAGTWSVRVTYGEEITGLAKRAAMSLVQEMAAPYTNRQSTLPRGVTSANVQGMSVTVESAADALRDGIEDTTVHLQRFLGMYGPETHRTDVWSPEFTYGWTLHRVTFPSPS